MIKAQADLTSRTGTSSKTACVFSLATGSLLEAGSDSKNIALLPLTEMSEYIASKESKRDILSSQLHKGLQSTLNDSVSCLELLEQGGGEELLFVGGDKALEVFRFSGALEFKKLFHLKEEVFSLKALAEGALLVGRGKREKKMIKGKSAMVVLLPESELNPEPRFVVKKTRTTFYCMFSSSLAGLVSKERQLLVVGVHNRERNSLCVENLATGNFFTLKAHTMAVYSLALDTRSRFLVTGGWDKSLVLWTPKTPLEALESGKANSQIEKRFYKEEQRNANFHDSWINHLQIVRKAENLTNTFVLTGGFDYHVKILSLNRFEPLFDFNFMAKVFDCAFFGDNLWVVGEHPDRVMNVSGINLMGKQAKTLKADLRSFLGSKYVDSTIKVNREKKDALEKRLREGEIAKYQVLLEECEHTIHQMEAHTDSADRRIQELLARVAGLEAENAGLAKANAALRESGQAARLALGEVHGLASRFRAQKDPAKLAEALALAAKKTAQYALPE